MPEIAPSRQPEHGRGMPAEGPVVYTGGRRRDSCWSCSYAKAPTFLACGVAPGSDDEPKTSARERL